MDNIEAKIKEYREYSRMIEELEQLRKGIADALKAHMTDNGLESLIIGEYKLSYSEYTRKDIDKKALQQDYPDIYEVYSKESKVKRFLVT